MNKSLNLNKCSVFTSTTEIETPSRLHPPHLLPTPFDLFSILQSEYLEKCLAQSKLLNKCCMNEWIAE